GLEGYPRRRRPGGHHRAGAGALRSRRTEPGHSDRRASMIPAAFDYVAPTTVAEALQALAASGDDAKVMGGGQSLLPVLRMRLNAPERVVDLTRIESLRGISEDGDSLVIGAMTTHHDVATSELVRMHAAVLAE